MKKIPVVLFIFKRSETLEVIFERIRDYKPNKIYLIADFGRNEHEIELCKSTRNKALSLIDWKCDVIKNFSTENKGVYDRIGKGAAWVLERELSAIFLEDDNYPSRSFFKYCEDMLERYKDVKEVGWVCGTNYLGDSSDLGEDYYYTHHLLPCGWASWSHKFKHFYDGELDGLNDESISKMKDSYLDKRLYSQELHTVKQAKINLNRNEKKVSWDRQMCFSIRSNKFYGIAPSKNLIKNIGVDEHSEHGGNTMNNIMTARFCGVSNYELDFPLKQPKEIGINKIFESKNDAIILYSLKGRFFRKVGRCIKIIFGIDPNDNFSMVRLKIVDFKSRFMKQWF